MMDCFLSFCTLLGLFVVLAVGALLIWAFVLDIKDMIKRARKKKSKKGTNKNENR